MPEKPSPFLEDMINATLSTTNFQIIDNAENLPNLKSSKILFAVELPITGISNNLNNIFIELFNRGKNSLSGAEAIVLIHSNYQLFTKTTAQSIIFYANLLGCRFIGRPMVEATGNLNNFIPLKKVYNMPLDKICLHLCKDLGERFNKDNIKKRLKIPIY